MHQSVYTTLLVDIIFIQIHWHHAFKSIETKMVFFLRRTVPEEDLPGVYSVDNKLVIEIIVS